LFGCSLVGWLLLQADIIPYARRSRSLFRIVTIPTLCLLILVAAGGCGPKKPRNYPVKGQVKLDGEPMKEGEITFAQPGVPPQPLPITNGTFSGEVREGKHRVEIRMYKMGAPTKMADETIPGSKENVLPAQYNTESKLPEATVTAAGPNEFKYEVTSK